MMSGFIRSVLYLALVLSVGCKEKHQPSTASFQSMGTTVSVQPSHVVLEVQKVFEQVELEMSEWLEGSPLTAVNNAASQTPVIVPLALFQTIAQSLEIASMTSGAFDPTWAAMWGLWNFTYPTVPSQMEVSTKFHLVDWKQVQLDYETLSVYLPQEGMAIGLGGIAKGVALNHAKQVLREQGIEHFMIVAGGQVLVQGANKRIGIRQPDGLPTEFAQIVEVVNTSVSTSGDYEKFFIKDGVRYHHIIDPRTGFPAKGNRSVTVIAEDAAFADAMSTALFVMDASDALQLINTIADAEAMVIDTQGESHFSQNFSELLRTDAPVCDQDE